MGQGREWVTIHVAIVNADRQRVAAARHAAQRNGKFRAVAFLHAQCRQAGQRMAPPLELQVRLQVGSGLVAAVGHLHAAYQLAFTHRGGSGKLQRNAPGIGRGVHSQGQQRDGGRKPSQEGRGAVRTGMGNE